MDDALLLRTADRHLRRKYTNPTTGAPDIPGLTTFADSLATDSKATPLTLTSAAFEGGQGSGQVTMPREIWLAAAEELLSDPRFNPAGIIPRTPRLIAPDFRFATAV
jgi:hypothetical protein